MPDDAIVRLDDAPAIPGLVFRHFRDRSDFAALVAVIEACQEFDQVDPLSSEAGLPTLAELEQSFSEADNIDLATDMLLVSLEDRVIGFQWVRWWEQADGTWVYYHRGRVVPDMRNRGIGMATMHWAERRIRALVKQHGSQGKAVYRANATSHEASYNQLLLEQGYVPVHSFVELGYDHAAPLPEKAVPDGFTFKPASADQFRLIWEANEEAFEEEWGHRRATDEDYIIFLGNVVSNPGFDPALWQIAWRDDAIAGVALCEITERGVGEISELSVRQTWRNHGLGRSLLIHALHALKARGLEHVRIFTDVEHARRLYESVGFRALTEYIRYQKPVEIR
ncbi:MAG: GNAT family N-acetyltransferase [Anaerolineae bacterium]|nr:GNAT family N-acetyltransferase [Anaerolineae bacterium]